MLIKTELWGVNELFINLKWNMKRRDHWLYFKKWSVTKIVFTCCDEGRSHFYSSFLYCTFIFSLPFLFSLLFPTFSVFSLYYFLIRISFSLSNVFFFKILLKNEIWSARKVISLPLHSPSLILVFRTLLNFVWHHRWQ